MHVRSDDVDYVNRPILVEGSWPESDDECLLSVDNVWTSPVHIGDTVELLEGTQDLDGVFTTRTFTVAGSCGPRYYTCTTNTGATSLGLGRAFVLRVRARRGVRGRLSLYGSVPHRRRGGWRGMAR